jgi:hypothetical protein
MLAAAADAAPMIVRVPLARADPRRAGARDRRCACNARDPEAMGRLAEDRRLRASTVKASGVKLD